MQKKKIKIIFDTNLWISFLISKSFSKIDKLIKKDVIVFLFSEESLDEFIEVSARPKFKEFFSTGDIHILFSLFDQFGDLIKIKSQIKGCRDEKDNFWLSLANDGNAEYLVTGDKDLLILKQTRNTKIITLSEFEKLIEYL